MILAPETTDAIINLLCDDKGSLSACSLACKQLLPRTRHCLFSEVHIKYGNIRALRELLEATSNTIALHVQRVVIHIFAMVWRHNEGNDMDDMQCIFSYLPNVEHLHLIGLDGIPMTSDTPIYNILSDVTSTRELVLEDVWLDGVDRILAFIYSFPRLDRLSWIRVHWKHTKTTPWKYDKSPGRPSFSLGTIILKGSALEDVTEWIIRMKPVPRVHSLWCSASGEEPRPIKLFGNSIHTLMLAFIGVPTGTASMFTPVVVSPVASLADSSFICTSATVDLVDTSNCKNVRKLCFCKIFSFPEIWGRQCLSIQRFLSEFPSYLVEELQLDFEDPSGISSGFNIDYWGVLATILAGPKFACLWRMSIRSHMTYVHAHNRRKVTLDWDKARISIIQGPFSEFSKRGLIEFHLDGRKEDELEVDDFEGDSF